MKYWLMKCEPSAYTIEKLARDGTTSWEGVRNYQARNFIRDEMKKGDRVLFYASNADPSGVTGVAEISREAYPDQFARKKGSKYYDEKATAENPIWYMVDIGYVETFPHIVPLDTLKSMKGLEEMVVTKKGSRLSIQPVTKSEFDIVVKLGRAKGPNSKSSPATSPNWRSMQSSMQPTPRFSEAGEWTARFTVRPDPSSWPPAAFS